MKEVYYVYILQCNDGTRYYGHTNNLLEQIDDHAKGSVRYTKSRRPITLVYWEEFVYRSQAFKREMQLKNGGTRKETINKLIDNFPMAKCQGFNSARHLRSLAFRK